MRRRSGWEWVLLLGLGATPVSGCAEGTKTSPFAQTRANSNDAGGDEEAGARRKDTRQPPPPNVDFAADDEGRFTDPDVGFAGSWSSNTGVGSSITLRFEDGNACMSGETAQVEGDDYATYFGAEATFTLCETQDDEIQPAQTCLGRGVEDFVGIRFTLENVASVPLPRVAIRFNEAAREVPTSLLASGAEEMLAFFHRQTNPRDTGAPPPSPNKLESITVRAIGSADGPQSFNFCFTKFAALFGEEWEADLIPEWLDDAGAGQKVEFVGVN